MNIRKLINGLEKIARVRGDDVEVMDDRELPLLGVEYDEDARSAVIYT